MLVNSSIISYSIKVSTSGIDPEERYLLVQAYADISISSVTQGMDRELAYRPIVSSGSSSKDDDVAISNVPYVGLVRKDKRFLKHPNVSLISSNVSFNNLVALGDMLADMARENQIY